MYLLIKLFISFLEIPGVFKTIIEYQKNLLQTFNDGSPLTNLVHGSIYQNIIAGLNKKHILPIILYFDDFESGNPLGSKAGAYKIGAVYYTIATIPPPFLTRLENIFLALLFYSDDRVTYGNKATFALLIHDLKKLETEGILIKTENGNERVHFTVVVVTGDNLGVHSVLGLVESFSANFFCRFCTLHKTVTASLDTEDVTSIRCKENYEIDIEHKIGLKEQCIFHELTYFHVYNNICCDIMHDLYEGVHRYDMALIIQYLIDKKLITLELLNSRLKFFNYDSFEKNVPQVKRSHLDSSCLILSASEMLYLVRNFRFVIGDLVPQNDVVWTFYLKLLKITDILTDPVFTTYTLELLSTLIQEHHSLYTSLFKQKLKPKHHFLLHYPRIIRAIGPPVFLSNMRYEGKHKDFKSVANNIRCKKNVPYSLAMRTQMKHCYRFMSKRGLSDAINHGTVFDSHSISSSYISDNYCETSWYEINGIRYDSSSILLYEYHLDQLPKFCKITSILLNKVNLNLELLICEIYSTRCYSEHYDAYEVTPETNTIEVKLNEIFSHLPTILHTLSDGKEYISASRY